MVVRAALRFGFGTASLLAGGWLLRALHGAPAALGATPAEIQKVAQRSQNYQDGVFVNIDPASTISLDHEQQWLLVRELVGSRDAARPGGPIPLAQAAPADAAAGAAVGVLVRPLERAHRDRRLPRPRRPGVESPVLAVAHGGPAADARGAGCAGGAARRRCGTDQPRPLRPPRHRHDHRAGPYPACAVRRPARRGRPPAQVGDTGEPHRRTRLAREPPDRRADAGLRPCATLLRPAVFPQHHFVGVVGDRRPASPRILRRRHRIHEELRRNRCRTMGLST